MSHPFSKAVLPDVTIAQGAWEVVRFVRRGLAPGMRRAEEPAVAGISASILWTTGWC